MWIHINVVYTNKVPGGPFRGYGNPPGTFARELMFDMAAKKLSMDPYEFRKKNIVNPEDLPFTTCNGMVLRSLRIKESMEKTAEAVNYGGVKKEKKPYRGVGIANMIHVSSGRIFADCDFASATVKFDDDGGVIASTDACDQGQGHSTIFSQIVAQELGVSFDKIHVIDRDTDATPWGLGTIGSRTAAVVGTALKLAAEEAKKKLFKIAAHLLEASPEDLEAKDNAVFVSGCPDRLIPIPAIIGVAYFNRAALPEDVKVGPITGSASFDTPTSKWNDEGIGNVSANYPNSTHMAVVDVDPETGKVKVINYAISQDTGKAINPLIVEGQFEGGFAQGLGYAFYENLLYDKEGILRNPSLNDYTIPTISDVPIIDKTFMLETENPEVSYNQKGVGETCLNPVAAAIANAVYDAIGVPITELPITPEKVLKAIKSKN
jgi:CO/xanthine dehydrogenase Mo-binding subunit